MLLLLLVAFQMASCASTLASTGSESDLAILAAVPARLARLKQHKRRAWLLSKPTHWTRDRSE